MASVKHKKLNLIQGDWDQAQIDALIVLGYLKPGSTPGNTILESDWKDEHDITGLQGTLSLTTTGTSGQATLIGDTLNIPQYSPAGSYVTSVTGTANRITSTGGTTPVIDIGTDVVTLNATQTLTNKDLTSGTNIFPTFNQNTTGSAAKLTTARNIAITGDLGWNVNFDGSTNVTAAGTLATVNSNVGTFGSASQTSTFTVNAKGLITSASNTSIQIAESQVTNLVSDLASKFTIPALTNGSVLFSNGTTIAQDNAKFFWDDTNNRLGIGTNTPVTDLEVISTGLGGAQFVNTTSTAGSILYLANDVSSTLNLGVRGSTSAAYWGGGAAGEQGIIGTPSAVPITIATSGTQRMSIGATGQVTIGNNAVGSGAFLKIRGGTTTVPPLQLVSGALNTTALAGAAEFLTDKLYFTITTGAARKEITLNDSALTSGQVPIITTNGRLTDGGATATELSYLSGVTSSIQTQLNGKQAAYSAFTTNQILYGNGTSTPAQSANLTWNGTNFSVTGNGLFSGYANFGSGSIQGTAATFKGDGTNSAAPGQFVIQSTGVSNENQFIDFYKSNGSLNSRIVIVANGASGDFYIQQGPSFVTTLSINGTTSAATFGGSIQSNALTASRAVVTDGSKVLTSSATTATEIGYVNGVTSSIQTQLNTKQPNITLTTTGTGGAATFVSNTLNIPQYGAATPYSETPSGLLNGTNKVYTLSATPASPNGVQVFLDGLLQRNGIDYTVSGATITFVTAPDATTGEIFAFYNTQTAVLSGTPYVVVSTTSQSMAVNTRYQANNAGLVTLTLPASANLGDQVFVRGYGTGKWKVAQNAGQVIHGATDTTTGTGGSLTAGTRYDCVTLECCVNSTEWQIINQRGSLVSV